MPTSPKLLDVIDIIRNSAIIFNTKKGNEMKEKIRIEVSSKTASEWGYGKYINAIIDNTIWAWECLSLDASEKEIKAAIKRVRERARYHLNKELSQ